MINILVPVDFSEVTQRVVETARDLAKALGASVLLLHVTGRPLALTSYGIPEWATREEMARQEESARGKLSELKKILLAENLSATVSCLQGPPVETILEQISSLPADFVVMGSHGHGTLFDLMVGSTASGVLRKASCPAVLVPSRHTRSSRVVGVLTHHPESTSENRPS